MRNESVKNLTILALLTALVSVSTMAITIPIPATGGIVHLGDSMIFFAAIIFGSKKGGLAAGVGSSLANIILGYTQWALPTLIIKSAMGYGVGMIADQNSEKLINTRNILALAFGALWMTTGYFFAGAAILGSFRVALVGVPSDLFQGTVGALLFIPVGIAIKKTGIVKKLVLNK